MSKRSRADVIVQLYLRYGDKIPKEDEIDKFQAALLNMCVHWGFQIEGATMKTKDRE